MGVAKAWDEETMHWEQVFQGILIIHTLSHETSDTVGMEVNTSHQNVVNSLSNQR